MTRWLLQSGVLDLRTPFYLGILNVTPDSFSDGGAYIAPAQALEQARTLVDQGAGMLDLGAESTRPGAMPLAEHEEWQRLQPTMERIRQALPKTLLSVDTRHAEPALRALALGASVLNDVSGFSDPALLNLASGSGCGLIAMRSRNRDGALFMPDYRARGPRDASAAIQELREVRDRLLHAGINPERILLDPGFGFGTTFDEDSALWDCLPQLPSMLDWPVERFCIAISRKRFLAFRAGQPELPPSERDELTRQAHMEATALGYRVFRSHALPPPLIRRATPADAPGIASVHLAAWRTAYSGILPEAYLLGLSMQEAESVHQRNLEESLDSDRSIWVFERAGHIEGYAATRPCSNPNTDACVGAEVDDHGAIELQALYVLPSLWGKGIGSRLMTHALTASGKNAHAVLWVMERNDRSRRFYERKGWITDGRERTRMEQGIAFRELRYRWIP